MPEPIVTVREPKPWDRVAIELGLIPTPEGYQHPRYKRNRQGTVAHHYDCPRAKNGLAWFWPENCGIEDDEHLLIASLTIPWVRLCSICFHFELGKDTR